jgi:tRNA pseudouridine55 synthase
MLHCSQYMTGKQESTVIIYKNIGETPLEALERFRATRSDLKKVPMTYAGRLDPMAEGELLILMGDECKNKEMYLGLDKEYEVDIVFGISTDTYDALGLVTDVQTEVLGPIDIDLSRYVGRLTQEYPAYSSKTVAGVQLHELARAHDLPPDMPTKEVEIYLIERDIHIPSVISSQELQERISKSIGRVKGDFRQEEILNTWRRVLAEEKKRPYMRIKVSCSSGTYMRSLAHRMGLDSGVGAFALGIRRTKIGVKK